MFVGALACSVPLREFMSPRTMDDTFGTTLFTPGLKLGTASTVLRF